MRFAKNAATFIITLIITDLQLIHSTFLGEDDPFCCTLLMQFLTKEETKQLTARLTLRNPEHLFVSMLTF
jgi:hypothetical protein